MAGVIDYSGAWAFVDGVEVATYINQAGTTITADAKVKRTGFNASALSGSGIFDVQADDQAFAIWAENMDGNVPKIGDSITIGSEVWNIVAIPPDRGDGAQWAVIGRKE